MLTGDPEAGPGAVTELKDIEAVARDVRVKENPEGEEGRYQAAALSKAPF